MERGVRAHCSMRHHAVVAVPHAVKRGRAAIGIPTIDVEASRLARGAACCNERGHLAPFTRLARAMQRIRLQQQAGRQTSHVRRHSRHSCRGRGSHCKRGQRTGAAQSIRAHSKAKSTARAVGCRPRGKMPHQISSIHCVSAAASSAQWCMKQPPCTANVPD